VTDHDRSVLLGTPAGGPGVHAPDRASGRGQAAGSAIRPARRDLDGRTTTNPAALRRSRGPVYAALDLGTNNCRLLIARPHEKSFRVLDGFTRIVRLGEGLTASGRLSEAAMDRTVEALRLCRNKLREHEPVRARLIATEACRSASNGQEFIGRVEAELGLVLEIVDRRTEAELAVTGCADLIDPET
jgi:exopolyphosphatase/guanosine-5'-triphosphate,3'-diphosphate pyrophosphatase